MKKFFLLALIIALVFTACDQGGDTPETPAETSQVDSVDKEMEEFQRTQDSILKNYAEAVKLINEIDSELNKIANVPQEESASFEQQIKNKIDYLSFQLKKRNEDVRILEKKIQGLSQTNSALNAKVATLEDIIAEKNKMIDNLNSRIDELEKKLGEITQERDIAIAQKNVAEQQAAVLDEQKNTAYYVIGTEKQLVEKGLIREEGEGFLGIGGRFVPVPQTDLSLFTKIDIRTDTLIKVPDNTVKEELQVISTHSRRLLKFSEEATGGGLKIKILQPQDFWGTDKRLILMLELD